MDELKNIPSKRGRPKKNRTAPVEGVESLVEVAIDTAIIEEPKKEPENPIEGYGGIEDKVEPLSCPNVAPPSTLKRNRTPPIVVRVCGNTIAVKDGHAEEARPRVIRQRKMRAARKRGDKYPGEETRI